MLIRPIPVKLLPHSAVYMPFLEDMRNGGSWGEETTLARIRIEYNEKYGLRGVNQSVKYKAVVFYDCANSKPKDIKFKARDKFIHNGAELVVEDIKILYGISNQIHHYELGCV